MTDSEFYEVEGKLMYFFTYYGEVYYGMIVQNPSSWIYYIIPNHNVKEYKENNTKDDNFLKTIGWEIKDLNIITRVEEKVNLDMSNIKTFPINKKCKTLFVFGAGASAYCSIKENSENKSLFPLGNELFSKSYSSGSVVFYKGLQNFVPLYEARNVGIETFFEDCFTKIQNHCDVLTLRSLINVQFYIQDVIKERTSLVKNNISRYNAYSVFATYLRYYLQENKDNSVALVSFNYDTLLDESLECEFDCRFEKMDDYCNSETGFKLFKPHGSINWGWNLKRNVPNVASQKDFFEYLYDNKIDLATLYYKYLSDEKYVLKEKNYGVEHRVGGKGKFSLNKDTIAIMKNGDDFFYPALLLPYRDKDEFVMPFFHQLAMETAVGSIEEIYLIGWKGSEELFLRNLKKCKKLKKLVIVNPDVASVLKNIAGVVDFEKLETYDSFSNFVIDKIREEF